MWLTLPVWAGIGALMVWGVWQAAQFRRTLMAEGSTGGAEIAAVTPVAMGEAQREDAGSNSTGSEDGEPANVEIPGHDEWLEAMTPCEDPVHGDGATGAAADQLLARASAYLDAGDLVEGRGLLNAALVEFGEDPRAGSVREQLTAINDAVFLGTAILAEDPAARLVEIQAGDSFLKLGQKYAVPAAFLELVNPGINPRNLKPMMGVKVVQGPFHLRMMKGARRLDLFAREMFVRSFSAEVLEGDYLPRGTYRVSSGALGGKIQVGKCEWIGVEGISEGTRAVGLGWLYGEAGPRKCRVAGVSDRISGVKIRDEDLVQLYNVLVEGRSLLRVEP
jgi:hypothetical protein